jgi:hypothetical protein
MNFRFSRALVVLGTAAALAAPAAAVAKKGGHGKQHKNSHSLEAKSHGKGKAKGKSKPKMFVFKGVVASVDADVVTVSVKKGNGRGRRAVTKDVAFDVSGARVIVADTNADGAMNAADVKVGDKVLVQARLAQDVDLAAGPHAARKLIDLAAPPVDENEDETADDDEAPVTPPAP